MPTMDQVVWATCNVVEGDETIAHKRGDLLPDPQTPEEAAARSLLRVGGALRVVEVVYTPDELAEMAQVRAEQTAQREAALDVDSTLPIGQQMPGSTAPGRPTLVGPSGGPVVVGDADLREQHDTAARKAGAGGVVADQPATYPGGAVAVGAEEDDGQGSTGIVNPDDVPGDSDGPGRPANNASKSVWVQYAVCQGATQEEAEGMTRDQLVTEYGGE